MDTFMDKLVQRLNAQEVIRANTAAETAELSHVKEQNALYEEVLRQVREEGEKSALHVQRLEQSAARAEQSAVRSMQSAERLEEELGRMEQDTDKLGRSVLRTEQNTENFELSVAKAERVAEQIEQGKAQVEQSAALIGENAGRLEAVAERAGQGAAQIERSADKLEAAAVRTEQGAAQVEHSAAQIEHSAAQIEQAAAQVERGADRVEQNAGRTEALIESAMAKLAELQAAGQNTEELNALLNALKEAQAERFDQLAEHMHRESVKVYRNVQAVVTDEASKQNEASGKNTSSVSGKLGAVLGISIIALLVSAAGLAFQVLVYLHII